MNNNKNFSDKSPSDNTNLIEVNDKFQDYIKVNFPNLNKYSLLNELLFYGIFVYYYYFGPISNSAQNFLIAKYIILVIVLRYVFNSLTSNLSVKENQTKYQLNSKLGIFIIMILFLSKETNNITTTMLIIAGYTLLTSAIAIDSTTVDNILTTITILYIYSLDFLH